MAGKKQDAFERLISKTYLDNETGCWVWTGAVIYNKYARPYGRIRFKGKPQLAHRVVYEIVHDRKLSAHKVGAHKCNNTLCVNPDHIRSASQSSNMRQWRRERRAKK